MSDLVDAVRESFPFAHKHSEWWLEQATRERSIGVLTCYATSRDGSVQEIATLAFDGDTPGTLYLWDEGTSPESDEPEYTPYALQSAGVLMKHHIDFEAISGRVKANE